MQGYLRSFAGDAAVSVVLPAVAWAASPGVFAGEVAADATSLADAGMVTVGVANSQPTLLGLLL